MGNKSKSRKKSDFQITLGMKEIVIIGIVFLLVVVLVGLGSSNNEYKDEKDNGNSNSEVSSEKNVTNTNPGVIEDKEQDGLKFVNTSLVCNDTGSVLTTIVQNTTSDNVEVRIFDIVVKDKDGNVMVTLQGYVGGEVPANNSREIVSNVDMNLIDATNIEYKLVK